MTNSDHERKLRLQRYMDKESTAKTFRQLLAAKRMTIKNFPDKDYSRKDILLMIEKIQSDYERLGKKNDRKIRGIRARP